MKKRQCLDELLSLIEGHQAVLEGVKIFQKFRASKFGIQDEVEDYLSDIKLHLIEKPRELSRFVDLTVVRENPENNRDLKNRVIWRLKDIHRIKKQRVDHQIYCFRPVLLEIATEIVKPDGRSLLADISKQSFVRRVERNLKCDLDRIAPRSGPFKHRMIHCEQIPILRHLIETKICA